MINVGYMMWNSFKSQNGNVNNNDDDSFSNGQYYVNSNIDTDYDGYQQAWRILGIYVDCNNYYISTSISSYNNNNNAGGQGCQRYLVWASYIDLQYQGGGIGEYQYYNTTTRMYDDTTCISMTTNHNERRCVKMDCHELTTGTSSNTWSLMGIYKEPYYASQFFEQLFKLSGYCVWDTNTYTFMQNSYTMWPDNSGCVASTTTNPITNQPYYIDLKPGPNMTLGIYIDSLCYQEYVVKSDVVDTTDIDAIIQNAGYLSSDQIRQFNDAMMTFQQCQPCRSYNLNNADGLLYGNNNNNNNADTYKNDPNDPKYSCWDVAGYINVNQCMKFRTHTQMMHMTRKDIHIATLQGTITNLQFYSKLNHSTTTQPPQQQQQLQSTITLSSSYHSIYFQPNMNDSTTLHISNTVANVVLSLAILLTLGTLYYCYNVTMWVFKTNKKQSPV